MAVAARANILPPTLEPVGISREQAAALVNAGVSLFDRLVHEGIMPQPRLLGGRLVWDVQEVREAFRAIPHRSIRIDQAPPLDQNPWD
jgi:predicted DNA-binding transcriptional regulator AlpA